MASARLLANLQDFAATGGENERPTRSRRL